MGIKIGGQNFKHRLAERKYYIEIRKILEKNMKDGEGNFRSFKHNQGFFFFFFFVKNPSVYRAHNFIFIQRRIHMHEFIPQTTYTFPIHYTHSIYTPIHIHRHHS